MHLALACLIVAPSLVQQEFVSIEPNSHKFEATPAIGINDGDTIRALSGFGYGSVDHNVFRLQHAPAPVGIYRHDLISPITFLTGPTMVLGRDAVTGFVYPQSNAILQSEVPSPLQPNFLRWYGFGRSEELFVDLMMHGTSRSYSRIHALETTPIVPHDLGSFALDPVRIVASLPGASHQDSVLHLFDGEFNPIPGMWVDDPMHDQNAELSFAPQPGVYYLAVSDERAVTHLPPGRNDSVTTASVLDYAGAAISGSATAPIDINVRVWRNSTVLIADVTATKTEPYELLWLRMQFGNGQSMFSFCPGDGTGRACPTGPNAAPLSSQGCPNTTGRGATARIHALDTYSPNWHLRLGDLPPFSMALPFIADTTSAHSPIHAGLACVGPGARRLSVFQADISGTIDADHMVPAPIGFPTGTTLFVQAAYRDPHAAQGSQVNLTGGYGFLLR